MARRQPTSAPVAPPADPEVARDRAQRAVAAVAATTLAAHGAAAGVAGVAGAGTAAVAVPTIAIPAKVARDAAAAAVLGTLASFYAMSRTRARDQLARTLPGRRAATRDDVQAVIADEMRRDEEFAKNSMLRVQKALPRVLAIPDPQKRAEAMAGVMARERFYQRLRSEAMLARAVAAVERHVLRRESPLGALWKSSPDVIEHTAGCLVMSGGGRGRGLFWPWAVLDRVHPPRHAGCPCRLVGYGDAVEQGLMQPGDVMAVAAALRRSAGVVMEADVAEAEARRFELALIREALVGEGAVSSDEFNAAAAGVYPALFDLS